MKSSAFLAAMASFITLIGVAWAIPPTPPIEVETRFKPEEAATGLLFIQASAYKALEQVRLVISVPKTLGVKAFEPRGHEMKAKDITKDRLEYSLDLGDRVERGKVSATVRLSAHQVNDVTTPSPVEVHVVAGIEDRGTAVGHASLLVTVKQGRLVVETPEVFQRERRIEAERAVREMAHKVRGFNIESILAGEVVQVDERALDRDVESKGNRKVLQVFPSPLSEWERQVFVDRSQEVQAELDPITVRGRVFFIDLDGVTRPLVNATVRVMDDDFGPDEHITSTVTGWDGAFSAIINNNDGWFQDGRDIYIRILITNSRFRVEDCSFWPDWTYAWRANDGDDLADGSIVDFGSVSLAGSTNARRAAIVFQRMNAAWNHFTTAGAQDPGFVDACYPDSPTHYNTFWEEIDIAGSDFDSRDIIVHEWGHAIQDNAQIFNSWSGAAHSFCGLTSREQAFVEGWASFVALDVFPDNSFNWNPGDTGQNLENYACPGSNSAANGPRDEGRVAAALIDLRDRANDCTGGFGTTCDANATNIVGLNTIWRDAMWGTIGIITDDAFEFWRELCPVLTAAQRPLAVDVFDYNAIDVDTCVLVGAPQNVESAERHVYPALTRLRNELKKTESGRHLVQAFFRSAPVLVELSQNNLIAKDVLADLHEQLAVATTWLTDEKGRFEDRVPVTEKLVHEFEVIARLIEQRGEEAVTADVSILRQVLTSLEGRTVAEVRGKLGNHGKK